MTETVDPWDTVAIVRGKEQLEIKDFKTVFPRWGLNAIWPFATEANTKARVGAGMSVEDNLAVLREQLTQAEAKGLELMAQYVANRLKSYEAFARVDPDAQLTQDAKERLKKALLDVEEFEAKLASIHDERSTLLSVGRDRLDGDARPNPPDDT